MPEQTELHSLTVRIINPNEEPRWNQLMATLHYLGFRKLVGESIKYVAEIHGQWVALMGWGTAAFKCGVRDKWIGWTREQQWSRLQFIANNMRFLILPDVKIPNLASKILALNVKRLSSDWRAVYGHPIILAETFVDHSRFKGTCYRAAGWIQLGQTRGFGRNADRYYYHGKTKTVFILPLQRKTKQWLSASFLVPELSGGPIPLIDLNRANLSRTGGLLERLQSLKDPRKRRGIRHSLISTLAVAICAVLSGARSFVAIGEWSADLPQELLKRLGCYFHPEKRIYIHPSEPTLRRHLQSIDAEKLDEIINQWLAEQTDPDAIAIDGKTLKGARDANGKQLHLMTAILHKEGVVVSQRPVDKKTNEITEFKPLLDPLAIEDKVVTADALHTQVEHARYLKEDKKADYFFTVKGNQKTLLQAIEDLDDSDFSP
jgi:hypothetical protein